MNRHRLITASLMLLTLLVLASSCGTLFVSERKKRLKAIKKDTVNINLSLPQEKDFDLNIPVAEANKPHNDTLVIKDLDGNDVFLMKAVKDEATGEMVANEVLDAAYVTARFRNVAERHGQVDIQFQITVPFQMLDTKWQLRFFPDITIFDETTNLDEVIITGADYRKAQLKGYQQYNKFVASIITDTTKFIDFRNVEIFLQRNLPEIYKFKTDSSEVSDEEFRSKYGLTEREAVLHYTNYAAKRMNAKRKTMMNKMYRKYVKSPIITDHVRLDTVLVNPTGDFTYVYDYTIITKPKLRKADVTVRGEIYEQDLLLYDIPKGKPVTFYISSISSFVDDTPRYLKRVINRRSQANTSYNIDFSVGKSKIDPSLGNNESEIKLIKSNLRDLVSNEVFDLDSINITASASPEGPYKNNFQLSLDRAKSASDYFSQYVKHVQDSLHLEEGFFISMSDDVAALKSKIQDVKFSSRSDGEDWSGLDALIERDTVLTALDKEDYLLFSEKKDLDARELAMRKTPWYEHVKNDLYPRLRSVKFRFYLHRKGMIKDTIQTTELDTTYMLGIQAIKDRDYDKAASCLAQYHSYNSAVAYCALDRNESAREILNELPKTAQVLYMLAIIHARTGDEQSAVQCYMQSCQLEPMYKHRGNLDPEISALIKKYGINKQEEEDDFSF